MKKIGLSLLLYFGLCVRMVFSQTFDCEWVGSAGNKSFNDTRNWEYYDGGSFFNPSTISNNYNFNIDGSVDTIHITANTTVNQLVFRGNPVLNFNGYTLSVRDLSIYNNINIDTSISGSELKYTTQWGQLFIFGLSNLSLTNFIYPSGSTKPNFFSLQNSTVTLTQSTSINRLRFLTNTSLKGYVDLNGYNLTVNEYYVNQDNSAFIIPDIDSDLIFHNLISNTGKIRFYSTGDIQLNSIQRTGTGNYTVNIYGDIQIKQKVSCDIGTVNFNSNLMLLSDASHTAYIAESAGSITTTSTTFQQYVPGRRVFRFFGNPTNSSIALTEFTDDIDITGSGGATNGFTTTTNNNPSAFYFDVATGDNTTNGLNPGWTDFSSTSASIAKYGAALIYVRGEKGQGLDGKSYTPAAATIDISGNINTGDQTISLTKGANTSFVTVGNPFASPINLGAIDAAQRTNVGSAFYVFDANLGSYGGYITKSWGSDYILPSMGAFATTLSANGSIIIKESDKSASTPDDIFAGSSAAQSIVLDLFVGDRLFEQTTVQVNPQATDQLDYFDAEKMDNTGVNFYSIATDNTQLAIDSRAFEQDVTEIPLAVWTEKKETFTLRPQLFNTENITFALKDNLNGTTTVLNEGTALNLTVDPNKDNSQGEERFVLLVQSHSSHTHTIESLKSTVYPNPADHQLNLQASKPIVQCTITDVNGSIIRHIKASYQTSYQINISDLTQGAYLINIHTTEGKSSQLFIKN